MTETAVYDLETEVNW